MYSKGKRMSETIAVLGAGNGGYAAASDLTLRGFRVQMFNPWQEELQPILDRGGIKMIDFNTKEEEFAEVPLVTTDIEEALDDARILMMVVPVTAHEYYAEILGPYLTLDHIVFLNPGHTGGGLHFVKKLRDLGITTPVRTCEGSTLTYGARITGPAEVTLYMRARELPFAAFPGKYADAAHAVMEIVYPGLRLADSVLHTAFLNINAIEHPAQILCNAGWLEHTKGDYYFYYEGTTPAVGRVIDAVDKERMATAEALGIETPSFVELFYQVGYTSEDALKGGTAYQALQESPPNRWVRGPPSLDHRYVHEDVGYGLVPLSGLGDLARVPTPTMKSLIHLGSVMNEIDYASEGRTLAKLGLADIPTDRIQEFLYEGES